MVHGRVTILLQKTEPTIWPIDPEPFQSISLHFIVLRYRGQQVSK
jgi:hypothetical protein